MEQCQRALIKYNLTVLVNTPLTVSMCRIRTWGVSRPWEFRSTHPAGCVIEDPADDSSKCRGRCAGGHVSASHPSLWPPPGLPGIPGSSRDGMEQAVSILHGPFHPPPPASQTGLRTHGQLFPLTSVHPGPLPLFPCPHHHWLLLIPTLKPSEVTPASPVGPAAGNLALAPIASRSIFSSLICGTKFPFH